MGDGCFSVHASKRVVLLSVRAMMSLEYCNDRYLGKNHCRKCTVILLEINILIFATMFSIAARERQPRCGSADAPARCRYNSARSSLVNVNLRIKHSSIVSALTTSPTGQRD